MISIYDLTLEQLELFLIEHEVPRFKGREVFSWVYQKLLLNFDNMTTLSHKERTLLKSYFNLLLPNVEMQAGTNTTKFKLILADGCCIETVLIPGKFNTLCISSQVGCPLACRFCATGTMGFIRNLTAGEIVSQWVTVARAGFPVDHIVVMGMGEPLLNLDALHQAIQILNDSKGANIGIRRFTISTAGIIPEMATMEQWPQPINLAVSLHAPTDELRSQLMPINQRFPLLQLMEAAKHYQEKTGRRISMEYVMLANINDSIIHANQLVKLLRRTGFHLNLIPYNGINNIYRQSSSAQIQKFVDRLIVAHVNVSVRQSKGKDIHAACGMLANEA